MSNQPEKYARLFALFGTTVWNLSGKPSTLHPNLDFLDKILDRFKSDKILPDVHSINCDATVH